MPSNKDILAAIDKADPTLRRSQLAGWMRANHDALDKRLKGRRTVWSVLVKVFAEQGLVDAKGNPPSPETARKTWQRIKHDVRRQREANPSPSPKATPAAIKRLSTPAPTSFSAPSDDDDFILPAIQKPQ